MVLSWIELLVEAECSQKVFFTRALEAQIESVNLFNCVKL